MTSTPTANTQSEAIAPTAVLAKAVAIVDLGLVDCAPLQALIGACGATSFLTSHRIEMLEAAALIIPDGPTFGEYVTAFTHKRLAQIIELRISGGLPVLACGSAMHLLCDGIAIDGETVFSPAPQWDGMVVEMPPVTAEATLQVPISSPLLEGIDGMPCEGAAQYALRSDPTEGMEAGPLTPPRIAWVGQPTPYVAAIDNGALCALAWGPENAGECGQRLLSNWLHRVGLTSMAPVEGQ